MYLFKASGATYQRVISGTKHAFANRPVEVAPHEFILLSRNRNDCTSSERQVQHVAKVLRCRNASPSEMDVAFYVVNAEGVGDR